MQALFTVTVEQLNAGAKSLFKQHTEILQNHDSAENKVQPVVKMFEQYLQLQI